MIFAGTPQFAAECLKTLINSQHHVQAVYTQAPKPKGRGRTPQPSPVQQVAELANIPVFTPKTLKDPAVIKQMQDLKPKLMLVVAYGHILPTEVLSLPVMGCVNVHASLLPRWRGAAPIEQAILQGDQSSGITYMQMAKGLDSGPILEQHSCPITEQDTAETLYSHLLKLTQETLTDFLSRYKNGKIKPTPQQEEMATYAEKINKSDAEINWQQPAKKISQHIRGYYPRPIAYTTINKQTLRIWQAHVIPYEHIKPAGTILECNKHQVIVAAQKDALCLEKCQLPNSKAMTMSEILNSKGDWFSPGSVLG